MDKNEMELIKFFITNDVIKTQELKDLKFDNKKINDLLERGFLKRVKRGFYVLNDGGILVEFGKSFLATCNASEAVEYFDKVYSYDLTDQQLKDLNFSLVLVNYFCDLPKKYVEKVFRIKLLDCLIDSDDNTSQKENEVRGRYFASVAVHENLQWSSFSSLYNRFNKRNYEILNTERQLVENLNLKKLKKFLTSNYRRKRSSKYGKSLFVLADKYEKIQQGISLIPKKTTATVDDVYSCIYNNNFKEALRVYIDSLLEDKRENLYNDPLYLLLQKMCKLIDEKANQERLNEEENSARENGISLNDVIEGIYSNNLEVITKYLKQIGKGSYFFLVSNLMELAVIDNDITYTEAIMAIILLTRDKLNFDLNKYSLLFQESIQKKDFFKAKVYLHIIKNAEDIGISCPIKDVLEQMLKVASEADENIKQLSKKIVTNDEVIPSNTLEEKQEVLNNLDNYKKEIFEAESIKSYDEVSEVVSSDNNKENMKEVLVEVREDDSNKQQAEIDYQNDLKFVEEKVKKINDGENLILLKVMSCERVNRILDIVSNYQGVEAFAIGNEKERRVVLKIEPIPISGRSIGQLAGSANQKMREYEYQEALDLYNELLEEYKVKDYIYGKMGICYMKLGQINKAIDYLTVADELGKEHHEDINYTDLIYYLRNKETLDPEDYKPMFKMRESEFLEDQTFGFNIVFLNDLLNYILEDGLSFEEALDEFELDLETIDIMRLIYAKDCYYLGKYEEGDNYLLKVERSKQKSEDVKDILEEVRKKRKFYKNRFDEDGNCLVLKR